MMERKIQRQKKRKIRKGKVPKALRFIKFLILYETLDGARDTNPVAVFLVTKNHAKKSRSH